MAGDDTIAGSRAITPSSTDQAPASVPAPEESGILADPHHAHEDARMVARALKNRWPIPEHMRPKIVDRLVNIATESPDDSDAIKAASVLRTMDGDNLTAEIEAEKNARLDAGKVTQAVQLYGKRAPIDEV